MSGLGWSPEGYDPRDKPYRSSINGVIKPFVDLSQQLRKEQEKWLSVYDQQDTGSCVANATSAAYRWAAYKHNETATGDDVLRVVEPSRLFVWYNARALPTVVEKGLALTPLNMPKTFQDTGCENRNALKVMNVFGVCPESLMPWVTEKVTVKGHVEKKPKNLTQAPKNDVYAQATETTVLEFCRLDPDHPKGVEDTMTDDERKAVGIVTLMRLKQCLSEGYPVILGFWFRYDPDNDEPWTELDGRKVLKEMPVSLQHKSFEDFGGHTVLCIGYDTARKMILCQNSWGNDWSIDGRFWMPYSYVTDWEATDDFWMIRAIKQTQQLFAPDDGSPLAEGVSDSDPITQPDWMPEVSR